MKSRATPEFWRLYRNLPRDIQTASGKAYTTFLRNPAHPGLRLERLRSNPRAYGQFALRGIIGLLPCVLVTTGFGFGSGRTKNLIADFQYDCREAKVRGQ